MNKNIKVVEVTERPLEGVVERAEFAESLLRDIASEAWVNDKNALAELLRDMANKLHDHLEANAHELRYGHMKVIAPR